MNRATKINTRARALADAKRRADRIESIMYRLSYGPSRASTVPRLCKLACELAYASAEERAAYESLDRARRAEVAR